MKNRISIKNNKLVNNQMKTYYRFHQYETDTEWGKALNRLLIDKNMSLKELSTLMANDDNPFMLQHELRLNHVPRIATYQKIAEITDTELKIKYKNMNHRASRYENAQNGHIPPRAINVNTPVSIALKELIISDNLYVRQISNAVNTSATCLYRLLYGKSKGDFTFLKRIAKSFNADIEISFVNKEPVTQRV